MYVKSLEIEDFKCFREARLDLQYPGRTDTRASTISNVNLIVGDNGGGKSSILRAIAIAALAPALMHSGFVPYRMVRRPGPKQSMLRIVAGLEDNEAFSPYSSKEVTLDARLESSGRSSLDRLMSGPNDGTLLWDRMYDDYTPAFFVLGYGATRRTETDDFDPGSLRRSRGTRYQRIASLFEDQVALRPLSSWLRKIRSEKKQEAVELINKTLPSNIRFNGEFDGFEEQFIFQFENQSMPLSSLSDGYKAFIAWVGELVGYLSEATTESNLRLDEVPGIVLVDEIDMHLHPSWQQQVIPTLSTAFPKLQFVFTTHSPLIASTVKHENLYVTDVDLERGPIIKQIQESVFGRSIEQILLSSYFGLTSTKPAALQEQAKKLFAEAARGDSKAAIQYLTTLSGPETVEEEAKFASAISRPNKVPKRKARKMPVKARSAKKRAVKLKRR